MCVCVCVCVGGGGGGRKRDRWRKEGKTDTYISERCLQNSA